MKRFVIVPTLLASLALSACDATTSETNQRSRSRSEALQAAQAHIEHYFGPIVDVCLEYNLRGTLDRSRLQELGYEESTVLGNPFFRKRFGPAAPNKADLLLSPKRRQCRLMSYPIVRSAAPLSAFIVQQMQARGFERRVEDGLGRSELRFVRGTDRIIASGGVSTGPYGIMVLTFDPDEADLKGSR